MRSRSYIYGNNLVAKHTNTLIHSQGKTKDIADTVIQVYLEKWQSVNELAQQFGSDGFLTVAEKCERIFNFVASNVRYIEDPFGVQWVKEPARLLADGTGDCKSMAIFICSALKCLDIPHFFRFTSYNRRKEATHVYAVALDENGNEIYIDPVIRPLTFNKQEKYTYKSDMDGTQIYRLAGLRRSSVGQTAPLSPGRGVGGEVWFGEFPHEYSKAKMSLLSFLELKLAESAIAPNNKQLAQIYNDLDRISLGVYAIEHTNDKDTFTRACLIISGMAVDGAFNNSDTSQEGRTANLTALKNLLRARIENNYQPDMVDVNLWNFFNANSITLYDAPAVSGIGAVSKQQQAARKIKEGAMYYIYTFIDDKNRHKYPVKVLQKKTIQHNVYSYVDETDSYNTSAIQANLVRAGIMEQTRLTPEQFLSQQNLKDWKISGPKIGIEPMTIIAIITAIISLIKVIIDLFQTKREPPTEKEINSGLSDFSTDFGSAPIHNVAPPSQTTITPKTTQQAASIVPILAVGLAAFSFLTKRKN